MLDEQWLLSYPASGPNPGANFLFGTWGTGYLTLKRPTIDYGEAVTDDQTQVAEDGRRFGRDYSGSMTLTFDVGVDTVDIGDGAPDNLDAVAALRLAWRADALRSRPGAVATLTGQYAGRQRVIYGRPRRFSVSEGRFDAQGYTGTLLEFAAADDLFYDGTEVATSITIAPATVRGLMDPLQEPLGDFASGTSERIVTVSGNALAWPTITFYGPGSDLSVEFVGRFTVGISGALAAGTTVTVDPRPWARTVLTQARASYAGRLTGVTRLRDMRLPPGDYDTVLRGLDATATARAVVRVRGAWTYL